MTYEEIAATMPEEYAGACVAGWGAVPCPSRRAVSCRVPAAGGASACARALTRQWACVCPELRAAARARNKFSYRYPRGESYQDIVHRLEPVIIELLRQRTPTLVVSHQATLRVLYAYLTDKPPETCPDALVPLHTVIQLTPRAYGCDEVRHELM